MESAVNIQCCNTEGFDLPLIFLSFALYLLLLQSLCPCWFLPADLLAHAPSWNLKLS